MRKDITMARFKTAISNKLIIIVVVIIVNPIINIAIIINNSSNENKKQNSLKTEGVLISHYLYLYLYNLCLHHCKIKYVLSILCR